MGKRGRHRPQARRGVLREEPAGLRAELDPPRVDPAPHQPQQLRRDRRRRRACLARADGRPRDPRAAVAARSPRRPPQPRSVRARPRSRPRRRPPRVRRGRQAREEAAQEPGPRGVPGDEWQQGPTSLRRPRRQPRRRVRQPVRQGVRLGAAERAARPRRRHPAEGAPRRQGARRLEPEQRQQDDDRAVLATWSRAPDRRRATHVAGAERPRPAAPHLRRGAGSDEATGRPPQATRSREWQRGADPRQADHLPVQA